MIQKNHDMNHILVFFRIFAPISNVCTKFWAHFLQFLLYIHKMLSMPQLFRRFLRIVKAGQAGKVMSTSIEEIDGNRLKGIAEEQKKNKQFYYVKGESLAAEGIHTGNILVATDVDQNYDTRNLKKGDFIILKISDFDVSQDSDEIENLKVRKFITCVNLTEPTDALWAYVSEEDKYPHSKVDKELFCKKCNDAKDKMNSRNEKLDVVFVSITYTEENGREYSFHPRRKLYSIVDFYINNQDEVIKF